MSRRARQAEATRLEILQAARRLFAERGYASASISEIAAAAGVALQTIYARVGSKRALLLALVDLIDEEAHVPELRQQLTTEFDPARRIELMIHVTRRFQEQCGDVIGALVSASPTEPDAAAALAAGRERHRGGAEFVVAPLFERGALRPDLSVDEAADILTALSCDRSYAVLRDLGWSFDRSEAWIAATVKRLLLA